MTAPLQHTTPRQYLRGFAIPSEPSRIWVYTKGQAYSTGSSNARRNPFRQAIRSAAAARGAYQLVTLTGDQFDADPAITKEELFGVEILQKLRAREPISLDDKTRFSRYVDLMRARTSAGTAHALPFILQAMTSTFNWDRLRRKADEEGRSELSRKLDPNNPESVNALAREMQLRGLTTQNHGIVEQLALMRWIFYTVDGDCFFPTTDNPAFFPPNGPGLATRDGAVLMPIDSQMVLLVCNEPGADRQYVPVTTGQYALFRHWILSGATEKVYASRSARDLLETLNSMALPRPAASPHD